MNKASFLKPPPRLVIKAKNKEKTNQPLFSYYLAIIVTPTSFTQQMAHGQMLPRLDTYS